MMQSIQQHCTGWSDDVIGRYLYPGVRDSKMTPRIVITTGNLELLIRSASRQTRLPVKRQLGLRYTQFKSKQIQLQQ